MYFNVIFKRIFGTRKEKPLLLKGDDSPFRKIVSLLRFLLCEIHFTTILKIRGGQNIWYYINLQCFNVFFLRHERGHVVTAR